MRPTGPDGHVRRGALISKQCACPLDGVPAATDEAMRGRRCYRWDLRRSRASACGEKVEIDACRREGGTCVLCHEDKKMKAKEDGVRAATAVATRFWTLPLSQCPGCPRVNTLRTLISARSAPRSRCLPSDKNSSNPSGALRRFTTRTMAMARHKVPRGGAVSGAASAALRHVG